jgi:thioredoxin reductase
LKTNKLLGTYEWTDFPLGLEYGVKLEEHISGRVLHNYFTAFAEKYDLLSRIKSNTTLEEAEKLDDGWRCTLQTASSKSEVGQVVICKKLMMATGLTSRARSMHLPGQKNFNAPIFNHGILTQEAPCIISDPNVNTVAVFRGSKSAYDCVHYFASNREKVVCIIRRSGHGPTWMAPTHIHQGP